MVDVVYVLTKGGFMAQASLLCPNVGVYLVMYCYGASCEPLASDRNWAPPSDKFPSSSWTTRKSQCHGGFCAKDGIAWYKGCGWLNSVHQNAYMEPQSLSIILIYMLCMAHGRIQFHVSICGGCYYNDELTIQYQIRQDFLIGTPHVLTSVLLTVFSEYRCCSNMVVFPQILPKKYKNSLNLTLTPGLATRYQNYAHGGNNYSWH